MPPPDENTSVKPTNTPQIPLPAHLEFKDAGSQAVEKWKTWKQVWENYCIITEINSKSAEYKLAIFLHAIGPEALVIYNSFDYGENEDKTSLATVIEKFDKHFIGETNETYERYLFNKRMQQPTESVDEYVTALKTLAKTCNFCQCLHDSLIRDQIIIGIRDNTVRKRLLQERKLTLNRCIDMCRSAEATTSRMKTMGNDAEINKIKMKSSSTWKKKSDQSKRPEVNKKTVNCKYCGYNHVPDKSKCPAWGKKCSLCKGRNHFAKKCSKSKPVRMVQQSSSDEQSSGESDSDWVNVIHINTVNNKSKQVYAEMLVNGKPVRFQLDCGAAVNVLPAKYIGNGKIKPYTNKLVMWNGTKVQPAGVSRLNPKTGKNYSVEFIIVNEHFTPLLGVRATEQMELLSINRDNFKVVNSVNQSNKNDIVSKYADVFDGTLGKLEGKVHLHVNPDAVPVSLPCRSVPVSIRKKLKTELERLEQIGVLSKVDQPTDWTSQFVATTKKSGEMRICIDPKPLNEALKRERYQLPVLDELLPELSESRVFTKVDLSSAFWHLELDEESSLLTTFLTPFGRYRWNRLPFGLNISSEIFQKRLHQALEDLPGVICLTDDIIVHGTDEQSHDVNLDKLLGRCREKGIKMKPSKLKLRCNEIQFHGHLLTSEGLKIDPDKVKAIIEMPQPRNADDIQRLNGMVTYLSRFLPHLSEVMKPLRELTRNNAEWKWDEPQQTAFEQVKLMMTSTPVLAYYDPDKELTIQCDSSQSGLGTVLMQDGRPISYASRALSPAETRYAQIEKEMLAIIYSMEKFHQYTYGRHTVVYSDHKPLETIHKKPLYKAPKRLQRMMIRLQNYDVEIIYCKGEKMYLADTLSRAYLPSNKSKDKETVFDKINMVSFLPIREERLTKIRNATEQDESLQILRKIILQGWPDNKQSVPTQATPYFNFRDELSVQDGLIFRGERVIIPASLRKDMMNRIHSSHIGTEGCLRRARECLYWPGMSTDIKNYISSCETCRTYETCQQKETLMSHEVPHRPWQKVASDLFTYKNVDYLVTVDYYSDYYELDKLSSTKSSTIISATKKHFARHGIPEQFISDNGPQYISDEFDKFAKDWDFEHLTISPYNSKANGKVENAVKKAKRILKKCKKSNTDIQLALLDQRNTPTEGIGSSPVQRLMNRRTRTLLPTTSSLLQPRSVNVEQERDKMKKKKIKQA